MAGTAPLARERPVELSSADLARLRKVFIYPVSEVPLKLKKNWKVSDKGIIHICVYRFIAVVCIMFVRLASLRGGSHDTINVALMRTPGECDWSMV